MRTIEHALGLVNATKCPATGKQDWPVFSRPTGRIQDDTIPWAGVYDLCDQPFVDGVDFHSPVIIVNGCPQPVVPFFGPMPFFFLPIRSIHYDMLLLVAGVVLIVQAFMKPGSGEPRLISNGKFTARTWYRTIA
jgi:hypothetical protein